MAGDPQPPASGIPASSVIDELLRDYHDARRREDQWRIPQLLLALVTPIVTLISVLFVLGHQEDYAVISGAVAIVTGTGAAQIGRAHV